MRFNEYDVPDGNILDLCNNALIVNSSLDLTWDFVKKVVSDHVFYFTYTKLSC